jgi:hypothetical protein
MKRAMIIVMQNFIRAADARCAELQRTRPSTIKDAPYEASRTELDLLIRRLEEELKS